MRIHFDAHQPYFWSVAIAVILVGAGLFALGCVEWVLNYGWAYRFHVPLFKAVSGLVVLSLGYIQLELEMIRVKR